MHLNCTQAASEPQLIFILCWLKMVYEIQIQIAIAEHEKKEKSLVV